MDMAVASLFKHKVRFSLIDETSAINSFNLHYKKYHYRSDIIDHGKYIGMNYTNEVYDKTKPIIYYILSTIQCYMEELEDSYLISQRKAIIMIDLIREKDQVGYITHSIKYEDRENGFNQSEGEITWYEDHPGDLIYDKFSISVEAFVIYNIFIPIEKRVYTPPVEPHREDHCVACLEAKPNILYLDCLHICICDSCERMKSKTFSQSTCDICRAEIFKRVKI